MSINKTAALKRLGLGLAVAAIATAGAYAATNDTAGPGAADNAPTAQGAQANPGAPGGQPGQPQRRFRGGPFNQGSAPGAGRGGFGPGGGYRGWRGRRGGPMGAGGFGRMGGARGMGRGMMMERGLMAAFRQLSLTPVQREQVRTILFNASESERMKRATEEQAGAAQQALDNSTVIANPGDPNYARAVQQLKTRATQRVQDSIQLATDTEQKLYNVLTTDQKAQLPKVLDDIKTRAQQRMNEMRARRQGGASQPAPGGPQRPR